MCFISSTISTLFETIAIKCYNNIGNYQSIYDYPSCISYKFNKSKNVISKREEYWHVDGKRYRENGPAVIRYYENGVKSYEAWENENGPHRINGAAITNYMLNGDIYSTKYYIDGKFYDFEESLQYLVACENYE